jgi:hypothetical protein
MIASVSILVPNLINALRIGDATKSLPPQPNPEYPPKYFKVIMESAAFILLEIWRLWLAMDSVSFCFLKINCEKIDLHSA